MEQYRLFVTRRALADDLGLDADRFAVTDAAEILDNLIRDRIEGLPVGEDQIAEAEKTVNRDYSTVRKFVRMRRTTDEGVERTSDLPNSTGQVWNLHDGDDRGVTWRDPKTDVVWLCAAGFHRSRQRDDFYPRVVQLDADRRLLPNADEVAAARNPPPLTLPQQLAEERERLLKAAFIAPESEIRHTFAGSARIAVYIEVVYDEDNGLADVYVGVVQGRDFGGDATAMVLAAFFPQAEPGDFRFKSRFPHRHADPGERIAVITVDAPRR